MLKRLWTQRSVTALVALCSLGAIQCKPPKTHIVIEIDTNLPERDLPDFFAQSGYDWDGVAPRAVSDPMVLHRGRGGDAAATVCLPGTLGVSIDQNNPTAPITLIVSEPTERYRHIMQITPVAQDVRYLLVRVHSGCFVRSAVSATHPCNAGNAMCSLSESCIARGQTCGNDGVCVSRVVPQSALDPYPRMGPPNSAPRGSADRDCPVSTFGPASDASMSSDASNSGDSAPADASTPDASANDASTDR